MRKLASIAVIMAVLCFGLMITGIACTGEATADLAYMENEVLSSEMADWGTPYKSFIKPAFNVLAYDLGIETIPSETQDRWSRETFFDALTFERSMALRGEATWAQRKQLDREAQHTFAMGDIGAPATEVQFMFKRKQRPYFLQFPGLSAERQAEMMRFVPEHQAPYFVKRGLEGAII